MLLKREGFPEEGELVWCKVLKVNPHSVFVKLEEYGKTGLINISEVSPGRIRNIRDYVQEGRFIVCKVLRVNVAKQQIDLSLRRVGENQKREKTTEIKQELKAEKYLELIASKIKKPLQEVHAKVWKAISKDYDYIHQFFEDLVSGEVKITDYNIPQVIAKPLKEIVFERVKPKQVSLKQVVKIHTELGNGLEVVKQGLKQALTHAKRYNVELKYAGAGAFLVKFTGKDYKQCEKGIETFNNALTKALKKHAVIEFSRKD